MNAAFPVYFNYVVVTYNSVTNVTLLCLKSLKSRMNRGLKKTQQINSVTQKRNRKHNRSWLNIHYI